MVRAQPASSYRNLALSAPACGRAVRFFDIARSRNAARFIGRRVQLCDGGDCDAY